MRLSAWPLGKQQHQQQQQQSLHPSLSFILLLTAEHTSFVRLLSRPKYPRESVQRDTRGGL
jgi:hypothetical protein